MKLRLRRSVFNNAQLALVAAAALAVSVGCSDDDSIPEVPAYDGGVTTTGGGDDTSTGGGGGRTSDTNDESSTGTDSNDTLTVNPTDSTVVTSEPTSDPSSEPGDTSSVSTDTSSSAILVPTSEPASSADPSSSSSLDNSSSGESPTIVNSWGFEDPDQASAWYTWTSGATHAYSNVKARTGTGSLALSTTVAGQSVLATKFTPIPGATYEVTLWASLGAGTTSVHITRSLDCLSGQNGQYLWVKGDTTVNADGWAELTGQFTVPVGCDSDVQFYAEGTLPIGQLYIDDVSVTLISVPDPTTSDPGTSTSDPGSTSDSGSTSDPVTSETSEPGTTTGDLDSGVVDTSDVDDTSTGDSTIIVIPPFDWDAGDGGDASAETEEPWTDAGDASVITDDDETTDVVTSDTSDVSTSSEETTDVVTTGETSELATSSETSDVATSSDETSAAPTYGANLHANGSLDGWDAENGIYYWFAGGNTLVRDTVIKRSGTASAYVTSRTQDWEGPATFLHQSGFVTEALVPGAQYRISVWVRTSEAANVQLGATQVCDGGEPTYPLIAIGSASDEGWIELVGTVTYPTCDNLQYTVSINNAPVGVDIWADDFSVQQLLWL